MMKKMKIGELSSWCERVCLSVPYLSLNVCPVCVLIRRG